MYVIIGLGQQGKTILRYLLLNTEEQVLTIDVDDVNVSVPEHAKSRWSHHKGCFASLATSPLPSLREKKAVVINCLPTQYCSQVLNQCIKYKLSYIDLGGSLKDTEIIVSMGERFGGNIKIVPDCGVAPGLVSSIVAQYHKKGCHFVDIYCGGLPLEPDPPLSYIKTFSTEGVIKEYTGVVEYRLNDALEHIPALSEREHIYVKGFGVLEAEPTSGSISLSARKEGFIDIAYKTLRYAGHWDYVKNHILNQPNPAEVLDRMTKSVSRDNPDCLILLAIPDVGCSYKWRWDYDYSSDTSAMSQITGYTVGAVATMVYEDEVPNGITHMDEIDFEEIKRRIKYMPEQFKEF